MDIDMIIQFVQIVMTHQENKYYDTNSDHNCNNQKPAKNTILIANHHNDNTAPYHHGARIIVITTTTITTINTINT